MADKIWTAAELEKMTPAERSRISEDSIVRNLEDAPQHLVDNARAFIAKRIASEETSNNR